MSEWKAEPPKGWDRGNPWSVRDEEGELVAIIPITVAVTRAGGRRVSAEQRAQTIVSDHNHRSELAARVERLEADLARQHSEIVEAVHALCEAVDEDVARADPPKVVMYQMIEKARRMRADFAALTASQGVAAAPSVTLHADPDVKPETAAALGEMIRLATDMVQQSGAAAPSGGVTESGSCCHCDGTGRERNGDTCSNCNGTCCSYHYKAIDPSCSGCRIA